MSTTVLLTVTLIAQLPVCVLKKYYSDRYQTEKMRHVYNAAVSFFAAITLLFLSGIGRTSFFTFALGVAFGAITAVQQVFNLKAIEIGPLSYTTVIVTMSTLIPALAGVIFWQESIGISQIIGMTLMVVCFILSVDMKKNDKQSSFMWLIYCAITFVCTGAIGIMQKIHQSSAYAEESNCFLLVAFAVSFLYSTVKIFLLKNKKNTKNNDSSIKLPDRKTVLIIVFILSGIFVAFQNNINLYLSGVMDSAVFFPIVNGGGLVLSTVASMIFFKEKLSFMQWIGILTGIASVVLLCNPFG